MVWGNIGSKTFLSGSFSSTDQIIKKTDSKGNSKATLLEFGKTPRSQIRGRQSRYLIIGRELGKRKKEKYTFPDRGRENRQAQQWNSGSGGWG